MNCASHNHIAINYLGWQHSNATWAAPCRPAQLFTHQTPNFAQSLTTTLGRSCLFLGVVPLALIACFFFSFIWQHLGRCILLFPWKRSSAFKPAGSSFYNQQARGATYVHSYATSKWISDGLGDKATFSSTHLHHRLSVCQGGAAVHTKACCTPRFHLLSILY